MITHHERRIRSGQSLALVDLVQSAFAAELLHPSKPLWIASPWISNLEVLDNSGRQFVGLYPSWPPRPIRLTEFLEAHVRRGGEVALVTRDLETNRPFLEEASRTLDHGALTLILADVIHEKGITGESFSIDGSMNLTYSGLRLNEEYVIYATDPAVVAQRRLEFQARWKDQL